MAQVLYAAPSTLRLTIRGSLGILIDTGALVMDEQEQPMKSTPAESAGEVAAIALNAVPMVGGVLSDIAGTIIAKRQDRRLNEFLVTLAEQFKKLEDRVDTQFIQTDEFQDLAEDIFSKAAESRQQEKLDAFRSIFLNTVLSNRPSYEAAAEIADLIDRWQARHVILVRILADPAAADREMGGAVGPGGGITTSINQIIRKLLPEWDDDQIDRTWSDLYDAKIHRTPGTETMMTDSGIRQLENRLTDFGKKVAQYISEPTD